MSFKTVATASVETAIGKISVNISALYFFGDASISLSAREKAFETGLINLHSEWHDVKIKRNDFILKLTTPSGRVKYVKKFDHTENTLTYTTKIEGACILKFSDAPKIALKLVYSKSHLEGLLPLANEASKAVESGMKNYQDYNKTLRELRKKNVFIFNPPKTTH